MRKAEALRRTRALAAQYRASAAGLRKRLAAGDRTVSHQQPLNAEETALALDMTCDMAERVP